MSQIGRAGEAKPVRQQQAPTGVITSTPQLNIGPMRWFVEPKSISGVSAWPTCRLDSQVRSRGIVGRVLGLPPEAKGLILGAIGGARPICCSWIDVQGTGSRSGRQRAFSMG